MDTTTNAAQLPILTGPEMFGLRQVRGTERVIDLSASPAYPTLFSVCWQYIHEHAKPNTADANRAAQCLVEWTNTLGLDFDCSKLARGDGRRVIEALQGRGLAPGSVRRILAWGRAALHHARKEGRLEKDVPKFPKVPGGSPRVRWLTRDEHRRLMNEPKAPRAHRFLVVAFSTGARSEAIEQLTWQRVDLVGRTIDFRLEGVDHKNKRRAVVPISDSLMVRLQVMQEKRTDEHVIGLGPSGRCTSTHHLVKRAMRAAGINEHGVCRHVARHTVASWMLQGDPERGIPPAPIHLVAQMLGDTVAMVERVYGHIQPKHLLDATRVLP